MTDFALLHIPFLFVAAFVAMFAVTIDQKVLTRALCDKHLWADILDDHQPWLYMLGAASVGCVFASPLAPVRTFESVSYFGLAGFAGQIAWGLGRSIVKARFNYQLERLGDDSIRPEHRIAEEKPDTWRPPKSSKPPL